MKINTPSHCAKLTMAYVTEKNVFSVARLMEWSLASPNIYQVENPWSIIKRVCRGECKIDSSKDLWEAVKKSSSYVKIGTINGQEDGEVNNFHTGNFGHSLIKHLVLYPVENSFFYLENIVLNSAKLLLLTLILKIIFHPLSWEYRMSRS